MKILLVSFQDKILWHDFFVDLEELGHAVDVLTYPTFAFNESEAFGKRLVQHVREGCFELVIVIKGEIISEATVREIKAATETQVISWLVDDPFLVWHDNQEPLFHEIAVKSYRAYDRIFIFDSFFRERLKQTGLRNVSYLPLAFSPKSYYPTPIENKKYDIAFLGTGYRNRAKILLNLLDYELFLAGSGWTNEHLKQRMRGASFSEEETNRIYQETRINLNIHHFQSIYGSNVRTFQILGAGGFLLSEPLKDLKEMFTDGDDLVFYEGAEDLKDKIEFYLSHDEERTRIALNGYQKAKLFHTFSNRFRQMLSELKMADSMSPTLETEIS